MASWNGTSESGILRKIIKTENHDELLIFGYACKLFRDDEKALYIDQGKHLIPWMGDESLKIDRYDCRGALSDLTKYEASREGYDATRWLGLSEKERNVEELCDKERYHSLLINEEEEQMYKEEEIKRQNTNTFQYSYDVPQNPELKKNEDVPTVAEAEEEYNPPPILDLPIDIEWPKTVKENARIEKTALFVSKQGPQMEILLKAKQADNPQFSFLNQDDKLYTFYRHILSLFKSGRYHGYEAHTKHTNENISENLDHDSSSHYLHPSLTSSTAAEPAATTAITIPQIPYKPSVNCAYSQLVNRIQGNQAETQETPKMPDYAQMTYEQQQYYQYYYVQQYFEYYKQLALHQQGQAGNPGEFIPPADFQNLDPSLQTYIQQIGYNQYLQYHHQSNNSYVQSATKANEGANTTVTQSPQYVPGTKLVEEERTVTIVKERKEVELNKPLLSLAAYGSGSDSESEDSTESDDKTVIRIDKVEVESYPVPTDETKIVIDKMALYVSKNGEQFEEIVKTKNDPRFDFLHNTHIFYKYYKETLKGFTNENTENGQQDKEEKDEKDVKKTQKEKKEKKVIAPVSFSIKKTKEEPSKEIKSALPVEESSDEEQSNSTLTTPEKPKSPVLPSTPSVTVWRIGGEVPKKIISEKITVSHAENTEEVKQIEEDKKNSILSEEDPILEMMELTDGLEEKKDVKRAEDKIKDKLAAAAREKLASVTRDRALQLERKKKAAAFLKLKSVETNHKPIEINSEDSHNSDKEKSPLRRDSKDCIEIIEIDSEDSPPKKKKHKKDKDRHKDTKYSRSRSKSRERRKERKKDRDRGRRRSIDSDEEEEYRKRKERRKKSHRRKHSKTRHEGRSKRKSRKRHQKSESRSSDSTDSVL
ncbi:splicing factor, suppressor of white-apricot homolog isoform X1 [Diorhabda sublineata]|uniref:splicing factor, suppressor of white-apricot homolog isoform X1 n=1 Tax=Diorhabda sublineata TaxID=1163346 RepID=UPI0024E0AAD4|nr:splicing factor, suppressor of white-apricot homolog isoform X1 [Diorhabda sublineata]